MIKKMEKIPLGIASTHKSEGVTIGNNLLGRVMENFKISALPKPIRKTKGSPSIYIIIDLFTDRGRLIKERSRLPATTPNDIYINKKQWKAIGVFFLLLVLSAVGMDVQRDPEISRDEFVRHGQGGCYRKYYVKRGRLCT